MDCNDSTVAVALRATRTLPTGKRLQSVAEARVARRVRSPEMFRVASFAVSVFHHPHETLFDLTRFRRVTRYDGARRNEF